MVIGTYLFDILQPLISLTYTCGNSSSQEIPAMNICDGHWDCVDGDDEDPKLCEGDKTIEFYGLTITIGYFSIGCLVFLICKSKTFISGFLK